MASPAESSFEQAVAEFDAAEYQAFVHQADEQRQQTLVRYPREHWPEMTLAEYAQGQEDHPENFCRWMEHQTREAGSIAGGSARKLIIYKHRAKPGWYFPPGYEGEEAAWLAVRDGFSRAFELADDGRWDEIDEIEPLNRGAALVNKTLWTYFPDALLPINSSAHLRHFLRVARRDDAASDQTLRTIRLNRELLAELRGHRQLATAPTKALERLMYTRFSPLEGRIVKIAPGEQAFLWEECLAGGYICVGWDEVGDLRQYESKDAFLQAFRANFDYNENKLNEKANEVWLLLELAVGERVVANRGTKEVLAVGTIESPGYVWDPDRENHKHTLRVTWDESYAKEIPPQAYWAFKTVLPLSKKVAALVLGEESIDGELEEQPAPPSTAEEPLFARIAEALERKNQAILYGPPGTGKTWHARGFARWWLARRNQGATTPTGEELEWVTFHPSYSYEDFVEGFRPVPIGDGTVLRLEDGIFKTICSRALASPERTYLLVIDEINRANLTKVLGELITLIEKDKRATSEDASFAVRLPYSKTPFLVPQNLFILGTMNTADRSIKMLDTALRRRFGFVELMPDPALLASEVGGMRLDDLLRALNRRVSKEAGREKQIGHSFFLSNGQPIADEAEFAAIFRDEIVPLLQEYAVDDYEELAYYLGQRIVDRDELRLDSEVLSDASRLLDALEQHLLGEQPEP